MLSKLEKLGCENVAPYSPSHISYMNSLIEYPIYRIVDYNGKEYTLFNIIDKERTSRRFLSKKSSSTNWFGY